MIEKGIRKKKGKRGIRKVILSAVIIILVLAFGLIALINRCYPVRYIDIINKYAGEYDLSPELVCAVIQTESKFNKEAVSKKGAGGLMQILDSTAYWLAPKIGIEDFTYEQIFDPEINIRLGCFYLAMLERQYDSMNVALCAYNAGSGTVDKWLNNPEYSENGNTLIHIPFQETRDYVDRVSANQKIYTMILKVNNRS